MDITYKVNEPVTTEQFIHLLHTSSLAERRPVGDQSCMEGALGHSNLIISAWHQDQLVGIARSVTDFHYCCYLSDLAVDSDYQNAGIGKQLQSLTQQQLGPHCNLILLAAPAANTYYQHIGFTHNPRCWMLTPQQSIQCE